MSANCSKIYGSPTKSFNGFDFWEEQIPQRLRSATTFVWHGQTLQIDRDAGPSMSATEVVFFALAIWTPGLLLTAYLVWGPRRTVD
jgi:hypothetical protein